MNELVIAGDDPLTGSDAIDHKKFELDARIEAHLSRPEWKNALNVKRERLTKYGYVLVSGLLPKDMMEEIKSEGRHIIDKAARSIDIKVKETCNSPRRFGSVNVRDIRQYGSMIPMLYDSTALHEGLEQVTGHSVLDCDWDNERMTMTHQKEPGDTHGWHWGDYQYALIFIIDHPPVEHGGMLQCVPHTTWNKERADIHRILCENQIHTYHHSEGEIYFFRTDTTLHRTHPLEKPGTRIILNFTYDGPDGVRRIRTHETQSAIYDFE